MTTTFAPAPRPDVAPAPAATATARNGRRWPLFGVAGGIAGFAAALLSIPSLPEEDYDASADVVIPQLEPASYRAAFLVGLVAVGCLFVAATAWKRWAAARAPEDLAARLVGTGLGAVATVNIIFYGFAGALGLYLPGGAEEGSLSQEGLFTYHTMLDFGSLLGWWGAGVAAVAVAVMAFRRDRLLPRWMGVVSVLLLLPPVALAVGTSLPGFIGLTMPVWLVVISVGMLVSKVAQADA